MNRILNLASVINIGYSSTITSHHPPRDRDEILQSDKTLLPVKAWVAHFVNLFICLLLLLKLFCHFTCLTLRDLNSSRVKSKENQSVMFPLSFQSIFVQCYVESKICSTLWSCSALCPPQGRRRPCCKWLVCSQTQALSQCQCFGWYTVVLFCNRDVNGDY